MTRRLLLALLTFGLLATAIDLFLLEHFEDARQLAPLVLIALSLATVVWHVASGSEGSVRALQVVMAACVMSGLIGVVLHFRGNMGFQLDMNPDIGRWDLFTRVMRAKAPPALAPGAMAQLGFLGLIYCYRHPATRPERLRPSQVVEES